MITTKYPGGGYKAFVIMLQFLSYLDPGNPTKWTPALFVTYCLQLYGQQKLMVEVILATGSGGSFNPNMTPVYGIYTPLEGMAVGQLLESLARLIQL